MPFGRIGMGVTAAIVALVLLAGVGSQTVLRNDDDPSPEPTAEAEGESAVMCAPLEDEEDAQAAAPPAAPAGGGTLGDSQLFFQHDARWGEVEYARSKELPAGGDWCGVNIAQCGCAMTSVANILALFDVVSTPDGQDLDPGAFNSWLNRDARLTPSGWISAGYFLGDVVWTDIQAFTAARRQIDPSVPLIRYRGVGNGSPEELRAELDAGRPVILELQGHFVAAVGLAAPRTARPEGDGYAPVAHQQTEIMIHDPFYPERTRYEDIAPFLVSSRLFEVTDDVSGILVMAPADTPIIIRDKDGNEAGNLGTAINARDVASGAPAEIAGSVVRWEQQWRDPTCSERLPAPDAAGNVSVFLPLAEPGDYTVEAAHPGTETCITVYRYDNDGNVTIEIRCSSGRTNIAIDHNPGLPRAAGPPPAPPPPATATPTETATEAPTETPTPTSTVTPTASPSALRIDGVTCLQTLVTVGDSVTCRASVTGAFTEIGWSAAGGNPSASPNLLFSTSFNDPGAKQIALRVCDAKDCLLRTTIITVLARLDPSFSCSPTVLDENERMTCTAVDSEAESHAWSTPKANPNGGSGITYDTRYPFGGTKTVTLEVCNQLGCESASKNVEVREPPPPPPVPSCGRGQEC